MFNQSLQYFINFRAWNHNKYPGLDWYTDLCSVPHRLHGVSASMRRSFQNPCVRHDFGYRNYGARGKLKLNPTEAAREIIDNKFYDDMRGVAAAESNPVTRAGLRAGAAAFYHAVRKFGQSSY